MKIAQATSMLLLGASYCQAGGFRGSTNRELEYIIFTIHASSDRFEVIKGNGLKENILDNDSSSAGSGDIFVSSYTLLGGFQGDLKVDDNGKIEYKPPNNSFTGNERFRYTACLKDHTNVCDSTVAVIQVVEDPDRPNQAPQAYDDSYTVKEGATLKVSAPGFLSNDKTGRPYNPLIRCDKSSNSIEGDLDTDKDGSFEYTAERCFVGKVSFTYKACYKDYPDMESNSATVTITVEEDRPDSPLPKDDTYKVLEAETLTVSAKDGLLDNDGGDLDDLFVKEYAPEPGFLGSLHVGSDGRFSYSAPSGALGRHKFTYEVCVKDWDCVDCKEATVTIEVLPNPNKPKTPPATHDSLFESSPGDRLTENLFANVESDDRYTLVADGFRTSEGFVGILNVESDGSFEYGNAPAGNESFVFTTCYLEWPDLCADGLVMVETFSVERSQPLPELKYVGKKGKPEGTFPLQECEAECKYDDDCYGDLICMKRKGTEVIPGCIGNGNPFGGKNFCIQSPQASQSSNQAAVPQTSQESTTRDEPEEVVVERKPQNPPPCFSILDC